MKILKLSLGLIIFLNLNINSSDQKNPKLILTSKVNNFVESETEFSCNDYIHGYLTLPEKAIGQHTFETLWSMPNGQINQHFKKTLDIPAPGRQASYVWFRFNQERDGLQDDSSSHEENNVFNGEWNVEIKWDNQTVIQKKFKVKC
ncbi:MAG: hypothetical protein ACKVQC_09185 [Elusimicrobiota bacterium]